MARKPILEGGKRDEILAAARECIFEKGYEATSVRMIMRRAGGEVGLFYYYFESKDEVFDCVLDLTFSEYRQEFESLVLRRYRDPFRTMSRFISHFAAVSDQFRKQYADKLHRTIRWALRERALTLVAPYFRRIIETLMEFGAMPPLGMELTAVMVSHGVGSAILYEDTAWAHRNIGEIEKTVYLLMGLQEGSADLMFPAEGVQSDIPSIVTLIEGMEAPFPGYVRSAFSAVLEERIVHQEVFVIRHGCHVVGCIGFSRKNREIDLLAVNREYRHCGIATRLFATAMSEFPVDAKLTVANLGDEVLGEPARKLFRGFGFCREEQKDAASLDRRLVGTVPESLLTLPVFQSGQ